MRCSNKDTKMKMKMEIMLIIFVRACFEIKKQKPACMCITMKIPCHYNFTILVHKWNEWRRNPLLVLKINCSAKQVENDDDGRQQICVFARTLALTLTKTKYDTHLQPRAINGNVFESDKQVTIECIACTLTHNIKPNHNQGPINQSNQTLLNYRCSV